MRTYQELSEQEQARAREVALGLLVEAVASGAITFARGTVLESKVAAGIAEAERLQTPWFAAEYVLERCREELEGMSLCDAEDALYPGPDEHTIRL